MTRAVNGTVEVLTDRPTAGSLGRAEHNLGVQQRVLEELAHALNAAEREGHPAKYQTVAAKYQLQLDVVEGAIDRVERQRDVARLSAHWEARRSALLDRLREEYRGRGSQYDILIERLVSAVLRAEQLEASGRETAMVDWRAAQRAVMEGVAALQRYTESTKSEALNTVRQQAYMLVLEVCDRVIGKEQPELWRSLLGEIERQLPSGG